MPIAKQIAKIIDKVSPNKFAYEGDENKFVWGDDNKKVSKLGVCWRPTVKILKRVKKEKIDMLVIHEPLLQKKKTFLIDQSKLKFPPSKERERLLKELGLVVYRAHSSWDDAPGGSNDSLVSILGIKAVDKIPYGRIGNIPETTLDVLVKKVKKKLNSPYAIVVGNPNTKVSLIATVAGSGNEVLELMEISKQKGADVYVSGDIRDSSARFAKELNLALVDVGGYFTEKPGAKSLFNILSQKLENTEIVFFDTRPTWEIK